MADIISLPIIEVKFKKLASNFLKRSQRGTVLLIIKDDTDTTFQMKEYKKMENAEADKTLYTDENYQYIKDIFESNISKLIVFRIGTEDNISTALEVIQKTIKTARIVFIGTSEEYTTIATWIKAREKEGKTYNALVYNTDADNKHIVNFVNTKVTFTDSRGELDGVKYLPSLAGILSSCNVDRGCTYYICSNLKSVVEVDDSKAAVNAGKFILLNDFDNVKVGLGINSLTTFEKDDTEDIRYIDIVEAMDLINDDIVNVYKENYVGKFKNTRNNQVILISAINEYFKSLAKEEILDPDYENKVEVDVEAQRAAWAEVNSEAAEWTDTKVINTPFKRNVYLKADIKIVGSMENLKFNIYMV